MHLAATFTPRNFVHVVIELRSGIYFQFVSGLDQSGLRCAASVARAKTNPAQREQREIIMTPNIKTSETNKAVTARFTEEFKNQHIVDSMDHIFSPQAILHLPAGGLPVGPDGQKANGRAIFAGVPDVHVTIELVAAEGNFVADTARGTHLGEFLGVPATGRKIYWTENHFYRVEDGLIQEMWSEWSYQILMDQLTKK
jgi:predicted ester cyclase